MRHWLGLAVMAATLVGVAHAKTFDIRPGPDADLRLQQAFAEARNGDAIVIRAGRYEVSAALRLTADRVTVRGDGPDRTVLSFVNQGRPGPALTILSDVVTVRDIAIENAKGDGVSALGADALELANLRVSWAAPPAAEADGVAAADAANVSIDRVVANGAPGAGFRLTGLRNSLVREVTAANNGVGLAVHNSQGLDVHSSLFAGNANGVLIRDRPGAATGAGRDVRVFKNRIEANNAPRPAIEPVGGGLAPSTGAGVLVLASQGVWVKENVIAEHATVGVLVMAEPETSADPSFNALPRDVSIVANSFGRAGFAPAGGLSIFDGADVIWDGAEIFVVGGQVRSLPVRLSVLGNITAKGEARFANLQLAAAGADPADASPDSTPPDPINLPEPRPVEIRR